MKSRECESVFEMLSEYLDGELPEIDCQELEEHIRECPPCVEFVRSLRKSVLLGRQYRGGEEVSPLSADTKQSLKTAWQRALAQREEEQREAAQLDPAKPQNPSK